MGDYLSYLIFEHLFCDVCFNVFPPNERVYNFLIFESASSIPIPIPTHTPYFNISHKTHEKS